MAGIDISVIIDGLREKLISDDLMKLARSEGIDSQLKIWNATLPLIHAVLADAGEKQITNRAVRQWLNNLQDLAYDIDDVLDDLATEALQHKLNQEPQASRPSTSTIKVLEFILTCCTNFTPGNITYGQHMSCKIDEITTKLRELVDQKNSLVLDMNVNLEFSNRTERQLEQTSLVDESKILGREGDKEALMGKLLRINEKVSVVSIVGMGGVGKTTLARILYNDDRVKDHFELRGWVCVSDEFDVYNISKQIFQAVSGEYSIFSYLDLLHVYLKEKLSKKRFLLVLDDVWSEDQSKWELLQSPLVVGAPGSKIIVTTRSTRVALVMDSDELYHLDVLSSMDALSLFALHALGERNFDKHPTLKLLGESIVQKCAGLPLAVTMLGRVLRTRVLRTSTNINEWHALLNSEIWHKQEQSGIIPALRLSYNHLPPHLKQLFAYCSLFPKDYVFDKDKLVLEWIAEGFLSQSNGSKSMESIGHEYFEELESRSFFQHSGNDVTNVLLYTMHDLINDLATSVAWEFFLRLEEFDTIGKYETYRHISVIGPKSGSYQRLKELQRARHLRTFLVMSVDRQNYHSLDNVLVELLPQLMFLRVLSLTDRIITKIPQSIGSLKLVRYLNFSYTAITCLPEAISDLYNLQSLLLRRCYELSSLPESFGKLINLRHLDIRGTPKLKKMPMGIGGLTSLQTLTKVIIEGANGFNISELKGLLNLQGHVSIMGLDKVVNPIQAKDVNLHLKKGLDVVEMEWNNVFDDSRNEIIEYEVLKELKPHHKLRILKILFYKGTSFPIWVGDPSFNQLKELTLCGCTCTNLPTLGHLPSLVKLFVKRMNEVKIVGPELFAPTNFFLGVTFPSLEVLEFDDMQSWQTWSSSHIDGDDEIPRSFPRLHEISIKRCPRLAQVSIGLLPSLKILHIEECYEAVLRSMVGVSPSLVALKMLNVKGLTQLHGQDLMHLQELKDLFICGYDELRYLWEPKPEASNIVMSLKKLEVRNCEKLVSLGEKDVKFESVKEVIVSVCDTLEGYSCPNTVERLVINSCGSMTSLTFKEMPLELSKFCLTSLEIINCNNLKSFPHEHLQSLTSLKQLRVNDCPSMELPFPYVVWPPNLSTLGIGCLKKPMSKWGMQKFPSSLVQLELYGKNSGVLSFSVAESVRTNSVTSSFLLPPSLESLSLVGFIDVESLSEVLDNRVCLKRLNIWSCPKLKDLPETSDSSSLTVKVWQ